VVDLRVERILKEGNGDQQHHAGAERDNHARRMPAGPPQAADAVAPRRPPRARQPPRGADEAAARRRAA